MVYKKAYSKGLMLPFRLSEMSYFPVLNHGIMKDTRFTLDYMLGKSY